MRSSQAWFSPVNRSIRFAQGFLDVFHNGLVGLFSSFEDGGLKDSFSKSWQTRARGSETARPPSHMRRLVAARVGFGARCNTIGIRNPEEWYSELLRLLCYTPQPAARPRPKKLRGGLGTRPPHTTTVSSDPKPRYNSINARIT